MKEKIEQQLNIIIDNVYEDESNFYFQYNGNNYVLYKVSNVDKLNYQLGWSDYLLKNGINSEKIILINNNPSFEYNGEKYVLLELSNNFAQKIDLIDISDFYKNDYNEKINYSKIISIWENKVEQVLNYISTNSFNNQVLAMIHYFLGLLEMGISIVSELDKKILENINGKISHRRIYQEMNYQEFLNPLNYCIDNISRDYAGYFKIKFLDKDYDLDNDIEFLIKQKKWSNIDYILFVSRLLYFDIFFDDILKLDNEELIKKYLYSFENYYNNIKLIVLAIKKSNPLITLNF